MYNLGNSPYRLFLDPDSSTGSDPVDIRGYFQKSFQQIERMLQTCGEGTKFDRIVFERVPNDEKYGIKCDRFLIDESFNRLLKSDGTVEWYGHDAFYVPFAVALDLHNDEYDLPIRPKITDCSPMTLRKKYKKLQC